MTTPDARTWAPHAFRPPPGGRRRLLAPIAVAAGVLAWTAALRVRDPHVSGSWGGCPFLAVTGLPCPACGGLRAVNDLTHGDVVGALSSNLVVVLVLPVAAAFWLRWYQVASGRRATWGLPMPRPATVLVWFGLLLAFGVVRNTPFGAWLAP
jgi:hypothetical protein